MPPPKSNGNGCVERDESMVNDRATSRIAMAAEPAKITRHDAYSSTSPDRIMPSTAPDPATPAQMPMTRADEPRRNLQ